MKRLALLGILGAACGAGAELYLASAGSWAFTENAVVSDTCKLSQTPSLGTGTLVLAARESGFSLSLEGGSTSFDCAQSGNAYTCPAEVVGTVDLGAQSGGLVSGSLRVAVRLSGSLTGPSSTVGTETAEVTCQSDDCAAVEGYLATTFPCTVSRGYSAVRR